MHRRILQWGVPALMLLVIAFGYSVYRYRQSASPEFVDYMIRGISMAPTKCPFSGSTFQVASQGIMYVSGTKFSADWDLAVPGATHKGHAVSMDGKVFYTWNDENDTAYTVSGSQLLRNFMFIGLADGECGPWWFADDQSIKIPLDRTFETYAK